MVKGRNRQKGFIKGYPYEGILEEGKSDNSSYVKKSSIRFQGVKRLLVHSEEIHRPSCWDFSSEVPVLVVTSPCVFWLPRHIPVCLDGRVPTHKPDLFITGKFPRFHVSGKLCLPIASCKHLFYGDFLQKNPLENI